MNKVLELQKIVVNSAKNIDFLKKNKINVFTSVPHNIKNAYVKITGISLNNTVQIGDIQSFTIDLFVFTKGTNNSQILEIMNCLFLELTDKIYAYTLHQDIEIKNCIFNIYNEKYNVMEDMQNNCWNGHFYVDIDMI